MLLPEGGKPVRSGQTVSIDGVVLRTPDSLESRFDALGNISTDEVYVYATRAS